jgi:hypothetical protein
MAVKGAEGGASAFSGGGMEGREAVQTALSELRENGLIQTITNRTATGAIFKQIQVTDLGYEVLKCGEPVAGYQLLETRKYIPQNGLLATYTKGLIVNSLDIKKSTEQVREEEKETLGVNAMMFLGQMDSDDSAELREKARLQKQRDYNEAKQLAAEKKFQHRASKTPLTWTVSDSASEFASRVSSMWHIKPWHVANSRFGFALAAFRKNYETNGEIELKLMDKFFSSIAHETSLDDGEALWKMFIKRAPSWVAEVTRTEFTDEDIETAKVDAEKSWEGF